MADRCDAVEPLLSAWLDAALDAAEHGQVSGHLRGCRDCRAELEGLARARSALRSLPVRHLPEELAHPLAMRAHWSATRWPRHGGSRPAARPGRRRTTRVVTGVAAGLTLLLGVAFAVGDDTAAGGGQDPPELVAVPLDALARAHLARAGGPVGAPALVVLDDRPGLALPSLVRTGMVTVAE